MKVLVIISMILAVTIAAPGIMDNQVNSVDDVGSVGHMVKIVENCVDSGDVTTCLAIKGITALNRAARSQNLELIPGITFIRDPNVPMRVGKSLSENEIESTLPIDVQEKRGRLYDLAVESATNFLGSHNLNVKVPKETTEVVARAIEEGRGKIKKFIGPVALAIGAKLVAFFPLFLGAIAILATKALIVAKIALVLAAFLGIQKFGGGGGSGFNLLSKVAGGSGGQGWASPSQGWSSGSGNAGGGTQGWSSGSSSGSYPYARSYDAQEKAYSAQIPDKE